MIMSRQASRLAGHSGTVAPNVSRNQLFTEGVQTLRADGAPPALAACSGASGGVPPLRCLRCRASHGKQPAGMEGTAR